MLIEENLYHSIWLFAIIWTFQIDSCVSLWAAISSVVTAHIKKPDGIQAVLVLWSAQASQTSSSLASSILKLSARVLVPVCLSNLPGSRQTSVGLISAAQEQPGKEAGKRQVAQQQHRQQQQQQTEADSWIQSTHKYKQLIKHMHTHTQISRYPHTMAHKTYSGKQGDWVHQTCIVVLLSR